MNYPLAVSLIVLTSACQPAAPGQAATKEGFAREASAVAGNGASSAARITQENGVQSVCFEPEDDCIGIMTAQLDLAREEVLVMAFLFSNGRMVNALNRAAARGVRVRMVVSDMREGHPRVRAVQQRGVEVMTRDNLTQHSKYLVIDRRLVITGSQNFTFASQSNSENTLVIDDPRTVAAYVRNWERRAAGSRPARDRPMEQPQEAES